MNKLSIVTHVFNQLTDQSLISILINHNKIISMLILLKQIQMELLIYPQEEL